MEVALNTEPASALQSTLQPTPQPTLQSAQSHIAAGRHAQALAVLDALLANDERQIQAWVQRALVMIMLGHDDEALASADRALALSPRDPNAHSYRGSALMQLNRPQEALAAYEQLVRLAPKAAVAHYNCANALRRLARWQEAADRIARALELQPEYPDAWTLAGLIAKAIGEREQALACFDQALELNPQAADARCNRGQLRLAAGDFAHGWDDYEWRLRWDVAVRMGQSKSVPQLAPPWQGQPLERPLLVVPEQGLGDQIFYAGMLADLSVVAPGATVCVEPRLQPLLARSFEQLNVTSPDAIDVQDCIASGRYGAQIHIGSLGRLFRRDAEGMARIQSRYLKADAQRSAGLRARLDPNATLRVGLSWVSKNAEFGRDKSLTLEAMMQLLVQPGMEFIDLQYGDTSEERKHLADCHGISLRKFDDIDNFKDIDGLAALIAACDIVLTVSNTTAHIAAALGKPVLIMLPESPALFWYWHRDINGSPWYPTAVLLRQSHAGDWSEVISTATAALAEFARASQQ